MLESSNKPIIGCKHQNSLNTPDLQSVVLSVAYLKCTQDTYLYQPHWAKSSIKGLFYNKVLNSSFNLLNAVLKERLSVYGWLTLVTLWLVGSCGSLPLPRIKRHCWTTNHQCQKTSKFKIPSVVSTECTLLLHHCKDKELNRCEPRTICILLYTENLLREWISGILNTHTHTHTHTHTEVTVCEDMYVFVSLTTVFISLCTASFCTARIVQIPILPWYPHGIGSRTQHRYQKSIDTYIKSFL